MPGILSFLILVGFLPWVDNYAHIFGFIGGLFLSFTFLPYLTFSDIGNSACGSMSCSKILYARKGRQWLIIVSLSIVFFMLIGLLLVFYLLPALECEWCKYLSCIPFTDKFCADQNIDFERTKAHLF